MLVLSRKRLESVVVGGVVGFEPAQGHGTRAQGRQRATRLRGRFVRSSPSLGGVERSAPAANQTILWRIPQRRPDPDVDGDLNWRTAISSPVGKVLTNPEAS